MGPSVVVVGVWIENSLPLLEAVSCKSVFPGRSHFLIASAFKSSKLLLRSWVSAGISSIHLLCILFPFEACIVGWNPWEVDHLGIEAIRVYDLSALSIRNGIVRKLSLLKSLPCLVEFLVVWRVTAKAWGDQSISIDCLRFLVCEPLVGLDIPLF